jgi:polyhydroxybutyrate depolymerase
MAALAALRTLAVLRALAYAAIISIAVAACRGDSGAGRNGRDDAAPTAAPTLPGSTPVAGARSGGCDAEAQPAAGDSARTLAFGGLDRTFILHIPPSYDARTPLPLVLNFHGFGSNARQQAAYSRFPAKADVEGFVVVSPDGVDAQWNIARLPGLPDDLGFARALLDAVQAEICIDPARTFAAGMSNGAAFAQQVACAMPERIAAVAAVTAMVYPLTCASDLPIAVIGFHGTEDPCVPFGGGPVTCGAGGRRVPPVEDSALNWARHDGCDLSGSRQRLSEHVRTVAYSECDGESAVVLFIIEEGGHTWPGSMDVERLGATTHEIDATKEIWDFFVAQSSLRAGSP